MPPAAGRQPEEWARVLAPYKDPALVVGPGRKVLAANAAFRARFTGGEDPSGHFCFDLMHRSRPPCAGAGGRCPLEQAVPDAAPRVHRHVTCLGSAFEQVTARRLSDNGDTPGTFLLLTRPLEPVRDGWYLVGDSLAVLRLLEKVVRVAAEASTVVIRGESGSGRACVARLLHSLSAQAPEAFVPGDCSAVESARLESVIFGRARSVGDRNPADRGLYSAAAGGTLFVREPQRLPPSVQGRIALLLEAGESACRWLFAVDTAAASPRGSLQGALATARSILVPPLRDRLEDLPILLDLLAGRFGGATPPAVDPAIAETLAEYSFPGNLRELECMVERACLIARGGLRPEHFPPHLHC